MTDFSKKITILSGILFILGISSCYAEQNSSSINAINLDNSAITPYSKVNSTRTKIFLDHNGRLEEVIQKLENVQIGVESDRQDTKARLEGINNELKAVMKRKKQVNKQLKLLNKELRTINRMKDEIRSNMKKNELLNNVL